MALPKIELRSLAPNNKIPPSAKPQPPGRMPFIGERVSGVRNYTNNTETYTTFTIPGQIQLYTATESWVQITLTLATAGPVSIGTKAELLPVLGGAGRLLPTDVPIRFLLPRGNILYVAANAINRLSVQIEPMPFYEGLLQAVGNVGVAVASVGSAMGGVGAAAGQALGAVMQKIFAR